MLVLVLPDGELSSENGKVLHPPVFRASGFPSIPWGHLLKPWSLGLLDPSSSVVRSEAL